MQTRKRHAALREIVETEQRYVGDLETLCENFARPLKELAEMASGGADALFTLGIISRYSE